jgi:hypothetical protein
MSWWDGVTVDRPRPDGTVEEIRFRQTGGQQLQSAIPMLLVLAAELGVFSHRDPDVLRVFWPFPLIYLTVTLLGTRGYGVELTEESLVMRGLRTREIPWTSIRDITVTSMLGTKQVQLWMDDGKTTKLRAPISGFPYDPRFDRKLSTLLTWWQMRRGW